VTARPPDLRVAIVGAGGIASGAPVSLPARD